MSEINLMKLYPQGKRNLDVRGEITEEVRAISRKFDFDYFDGDRKYGYGGYNYHPRFWTDTVKLFRDHYQLPENASILDVGCGKGFMLYDFQQLMPKASLRGIDLSSYAIDHAKEEMKPLLQQGNAKKLPFEDKSFDLVISINTLHNLNPEDCKQGIREIQRVSRGKSFIMVDGWNNDEEKALMDRWVLTAVTMMHVDQWKKVLQDVDYTGDYFFWVVT